MDSRCITPSELDRVLTIPYMRDTRVQVHLELVSENDRRLFKRTFV